MYRNSTVILLMGIFLLTPALLAEVPSIFQHPAFEHDIQGAVGTDPAWDSLEKGLKVSFGSIDELYLRNRVPTTEVKKKLVVTAWRGERANIQLLLWSRVGAKDVRIKSEELRLGGGELLGAAVGLHLVRYTVSDYPVGAIDFTCSSESTEVHLLPDVLDRMEVFEIPARSVRPVWITVDIPRGAEVGRYQTTLTVRTGTGDSESLRLAVNVQPGVVPKPIDWRFRLDLWQNPWAVAYYHDVQPWSEVHMALLRPHLQRLAETGQRFVTTYVSHSPWTDDTYTVDSTMVEWIRQPDGTFSFDYRIFDQYVELAQECGINDSITAYTMLPWEHRVRYLDGATGSYVRAQWSPDSEKFQSFWRSFLGDFRTHLLEKGWFDKTFIGINENPLEDSLASIELVKEHSKQWKITYAGELHEELLGLVDDYSVIIDQPMTDRMISARKERGQTSTFYVCCNPPKPNNFPFSPPAEGAWMGWHAFARGYDGFLRWAFDNWTADPLRDTRHTKWAAGDCFLVYPDGRSSIRFERLREGLVDFEKLHIVRRKLQLREDAEARRGLEALSLVLSRFTYEAVQQEPAAETVNEAKILLDELSELVFED